MAFGVFIHRTDSIYEDIPSEQYQFPKQYLSRAQQCEGDWIVYLVRTAGEAATRDATVDGDSVTRVEPGIWRNEETGEVFTGGTYRPQTPGGTQVRRSIRAALSSDGDEE